MRYIYGALFFLLLAVPAAALAVEPKNGQATTNIQADRMQYDAANQQVIFDGNVHVTRPDFELWGTKLTVYLEKNGRAAKPSAASGNSSNPGVGGMGMSAGDINRIVAEKNVRMRQDTKVGTCGKATYTLADAKLVMEDNPLIVDGSNRIAGKVINFYTRDNRSEVIGGVKAAFVTTDGKEGQNPLLPQSKNNDSETRPVPNSPEKVQ